MAYSLFDASIPVYLHMLKNLAAILEKAEAHAKAAGVDPESYLDSRLAPDMHPLTNQVQLASDAAKGGAARLAGVTPPSFPDTETSWADVKARVARTIAFVEGVKREQLDGREDATIEIPLPGRTLSFSGRDFLALFSLPNFMFHVTMAYGLLRARGVPLGKMDFLNGAQAVTF
ncbi:DUF1993 family protein [Phenylobacterium sp.]|uniref:DUF1993 domain-containing protein n=1 Tax=Phenylobacterium sp. TaxID=1871053 RepID=UPI0025F024F9|nr:DUF1993 domain-containing protein [Phenylobacterium sp.]MBX3486019.1 DUF1993 domain-containing protein [Phenylobacterium sp.]MCW5761508.1 DUF1993 domain-containing protein [Phenylobacterium sp.]